MAQRPRWLYPFCEAESHLLEELMIINPTKGWRYVFKWEGDANLEQPEFVIARKHWKHIVAEDWTTMPIPIRWLGGLDKITVRYRGDEPRPPSCGCFLNVNALDFGIEVDQIARIRLDRHAVLLDGELRRNRLLHRPVALFRTDRLQNELREALAAEKEARQPAFYPDLFFYWGTMHSPDELEETINEHWMGYLQREGLRTGAEVRGYLAEAHKFNLCPVTQRIVRRHMNIRPKPLPERGGAGPRDSDVFVSFAHEDTELAQNVVAGLHERGMASVFFYLERDYHPSWSEAIDDALDSARSLVALGTRVAHFRRPWVKFEWRTFHQDIMADDQATKRLIPFVSGIDIRDLPAALRYYSLVEHNPDDLKSSLDHLVRLMRNGNSRQP